jgi:hypothetical protein
MRWIWRCFAEHVGTAALGCPGERSSPIAIPYIVSELALEAVLRDYNDFLKKVIDHCLQEIVLS